MEFWDDYWIGAGPVCCVKTWSWIGFNDSTFWNLVREVFPCLSCCQLICLYRAARPCCSLADSCQPVSLPLEVPPNGSPALHLINCSTQWYHSQNIVHSILSFWSLIKILNRISERALRASSLLKICLPGLRANLGIAQLRAIPLPLVDLDRVVPDISSGRPQQRLTSFFWELL